MIQTSQITDVGISKTALYQYVKANDMEQISHGVYATKNTWTDVMYLVHLRCKQAVFSHETALFLHDLTDREPLEYEITVKTGYNPSKLKDDGIKVYTIKKELHGEGITTMQTSLDIWYLSIIWRELSVISSEIGIIRRYRHSKLH